MVERLRDEAHIAVGTKQTLKALYAGQATCVYVAEDAEEHVVAPLKQQAQQHGVPIVYVPTMMELGKACRIEVGAAAAAILK